MKKETRFWATEMRAVEGDGKMVVRGYAAVFDKFSQILGSFKEKIARGAFEESIKKNDVVALWSHNIDIVLGRTSNNTLRLTEDEHGLAFELELTDTTAGTDAYKDIKRGNVKGMSFGFRVREDNWKKGEEGQPHERTLLNIDLLEVSPTAFPAYGDTNVSARDAESLVEEVEKKWAEESRVQGQGISTLEQKQRSVEAWRPKV